MKKTLIAILIFISTVALTACTQDITCGLGYTMFEENCEWIDKYPDIETIEPEFIGDLQSNEMSELVLPEWIEDSVMYEVNLRQYTDSGTILAFMEELV